MSEFMTETGSIQLPLNNRRFSLCFRAEMKTEYLSSKVAFPSMFKFSYDNLFLTDFPSNNKKTCKQINPYAPEGNSQMALLLSEIFFICSTIPPTENATIVYVGAHPGDHINFLAKFFENCHFILYDFIKNKPVMNKIGLDPLTEEPLKNITKINEVFNDNTASEILRSSYENLYFISDIRNTRYDIKLSPIVRAEIIDDDTYKQLRWCQILKPKYALLKYRPKREDEMVTTPENLSKSGDSAERKKAYYYYPDGKFIFLPYQKGVQSNFYFITNDYTQSKEYYHMDLNAASEYHRSFIRTSAIYPNPFKKHYGLYKACIGLEDVLNAAKTLPNISMETFQPRYYCMGCNWDSRVAIYIFLMYLQYRGVTVEKKTTGIDDIFQRAAIDYLVKPFILMRENAIKDASETAPSYQDE